MPTNCTVCGLLDLNKSRLSRHMKSQQEQIFRRSDNLAKHMRHCTGHRPPPQQLPQKQQQQQQQKQQHASTQPPPKLSFHHQYTSMGGAVERYNINMLERQHLDHLPTALHLHPTNNDPVLHRQVAITIVCHKAVELIVVTHPPVTQPRK